MVLGRNECGSNAMVTVQMTVEEYLEIKSRQETKEVTTKQKNLVYVSPLCILTVILVIISRLFSVI